MFASQTAPAWVLKGDVLVSPMGAGRRCDDSCLCGTVRGECSHLHPTGGHVSYE